MKQLIFVAGSGGDARIRALQCWEDSRPVWRRHLAGCPEGVSPSAGAGGTSPEPAPSLAFGGCGRDARTTAGGTPALL